MGFVELLVVEGRELLFCFGILGVIFVLVLKKKKTNNKETKKNLEKSIHLYHNTLGLPQFGKQILGKQ